MKQIFISVLFVILFVSCNNNAGKRQAGGESGIDKSIKDTAMVEPGQPDNVLLDETEDQSNGPVYMFIGQMPEYAGGEKAFRDFVIKNMNYPSSAVKDKIEGRVVVKFIIRPGGKVTDIRVIRSIRADLDNECLRVMKMLPDWKPGLVNGKEVSVSFSIPVRFMLKSEGMLNGICILPAGSK
ncbi:MAG: energy transducer TonB [Bacteroidales bacterium]